MNVLIDECAPKAPSSQNMATNLGPSRKPDGPENKTENY